VDQLAAITVGPWRMTTLDIDKRPNGREPQKDWTSLRAWSQAIGIIGIPGTIAIFLVYMGASEVPRLARQQELMLREIQATQAQIAELVDLTATLIRIAQRSCSNSAKDDNARQRCFDR